MEKSKDILDGILFYTKKEQDKNPEHFYQYPERVLKTLVLFQKYFKLSDGSIPSKKQKSNFEEWITQLDILNQICPSEKMMEEAMKISKEDYDKIPRKFMIVRPLSIRTLLINAVRKINDQKEENIIEHKDTPMENIDISNLASSSDVKNELKSLMEDT